MKRTAEQRNFEALAGAFGTPEMSPARLRETGERAKASDGAAALEAAAAIAHIAFVSPGASMAVMDGLVRGWLGGGAELPETPAEQTVMLASLGEAEQPDDAFWERFWDFTGNTEGPMTGDEVTERVASFASALPESFTARAEAAAIAHPGAAGAATRPLPPKLTLEALGTLPEGSLGNDIYRLIVDNSFNLEVLDREAVGLGDMPPALRYLNTRILQMHDVWHLMGGYRTTVLQEVGISAFQFAQFGHNYSGMLIATAAISSAFTSPEAFGLIMQIIAEGWQHGRVTPSFMAIDWEAEWHLPIEEIRARHGITPFTSLFPADLVEQLRAA